MVTKILYMQLSHCGPTCTHYWVYEDGPYCCIDGKKGKAIPAEYDMAQGFPSFCALERQHGKEKRKMPKIKTWGKIK